MPGRVAKSLGPLAITSWFWETMEVNYLGELQVPLSSALEFHVSGDKPLG